MSINKEKLIIIVSQLTGDGPTGVEKHFNLIIQDLNEFGFKTILVTPHNTNYFTRKFGHAIYLSLKIINIELATLFILKLNYYRLKNKIKNILKENLNIQLTIYAQDPLSTLASLSTNFRNSMRIVSVSHFNISEAHEMETKKLIKKGGILWNYLMQTELDAYSKSDKIIFVSKFMRDSVNKRLVNLKIDKQEIIFNYAPITNYKPITLKLTNEKHQKLVDLISIGSLEERKNHKYLLDVLEICKKNGKNFDLTIVGIGPYLNYLKKYCFEKGIQEQVKFIGFLPNASCLFERHRIFVHSAKMENLSIALIEAIGHGMPVITSSTGGTPEIVSEGVEAIFWDLDDPTDGANKLINLYSDENMLKKLSENARKKYLNHFESSVVSKK